MPPETGEFNTFEKANPRPSFKTNKKMQIRFFLIPVCLFLFPKFALSNSFHTGKTAVILAQEAEQFLSENECIEIKNLNGDKRPVPFLKFLHNQQKKNRKLTAAILAFPFPFGIVGLHRIYLGSAPYVPVVYIASFGGVLGLLPLIDFCCILLDKNTEKFENNKKVFMWIN